MRITVIKVMRTMPGRKVFVEITNKDIYQSLQKLHDNLENYQSQNVLDHRAIMDRQDLTNGKVKRNYLVAYAAICLSMVILGFFVTHLI